MSGMFRTVPPRAFPITLGDLTFYATAWKLTGTRLYVEQGSVTGSYFVTNSSRRAKRLVLDGKFFFLEAPSEILLPLDTAVINRQLFAFEMRNIRFSDTRIEEYTISEEAAEGVLPCRITLIVPGTLVYVPEKTEETS